MIDDGDGVEQATLLDFIDQHCMLRARFGLRYVEIEDLCDVTEAPLYLGADYGRDLLRRPGGTSTAAETCGIGRHIEDLYGHQRLGHECAFRSVAQLDDIAPVGQTRAHTPQPEHRSSTTR